MVSTFVRVAVLAVLWVGFLASLFYGSGLQFPVVFLSSHLGTLPNSNSSVWTALFPIHSWASPWQIKAVVSSASAELGRLPFFAEAAPFFIFGVVFEVLLSKMLRRNVYSFHDAISSLSLGLLQEVGSAAFKIPIAGMYSYLFTHFRLLNVDDHPLAAFYIGFIMVDMGYYWAHRFSHECMIMWASHSVHHSSERYNLSTALRQNLISWLFGFACYLPCALLGVPLSVMLTHQTFSTLWQYHLHTRLIGRLGPWEWIFNTPSHHAVHHGRNPRCIDKNYGSIFIVWDRLFGTFHDEAWGEDALVYGVVPPLRSMSPLWANFIEWKDLADRMISTPGWVNKLSLPFRGPGWRYSAKTGALKWWPVPPLGHKMNPLDEWQPKGPGFMATAYALAHFSLLIAAYFIGGSCWREPSTALIGAVVFGLSLHCITGILECRSHARLQELLRCLVGVGFASIQLFAPPAWNAALGMPPVDSYAQQLLLAVSTLSFLVTLVLELRPVAAPVAVHADAKAAVTPALSGPLPVSGLSQPQPSRSALGGPSAQGNGDDAQAQGNASSATQRPKEE